MAFPYLRGVQEGKRDLGKDFLNLGLDGNRWKEKGL